MQLYTRFDHQLHKKLTDIEGLKVFRFYEAYF